jgi:hypothetical protein
LQRRKAEQIAALQKEGHLRLGSLTDQAYLAAGAALYAGEGSKREQKVSFANTDPLMIAFFCAWLRRFFAIDQSRLRVRIYLHQGLDISAAEEFWSEVTGVPREQFGKPYRAVANPTIRLSKHQFGCVYVTYCCATTHRAIMGLVGGLLSSSVPSGVAQSAEHAAVNRVVESSSLSPGATAEPADYSLSR